MKRHQTYRPPLPQNPPKDSAPSFVPWRLRDSAAHRVRYEMTVARAEAKGEYGQQEAQWAYVVRCVPPIFSSPVVATHTSFRLTPIRPRPRRTAPLWRNLRQPPRRDWSFTFSAKEKDVETGLSYFGSRYYSSDLSIWLSVDPMAMKFPHQSNYVYCSNNPLKVIDPNGEDEWEVNQSGYIRHIKNNKPDRLYAVYGYGKERWGKRKSDVDPLDVDKSIMNTIDNRGKYTTFSAQNNRAKMDELFDFFADNTEVEWTQLSIHDEFENQYDYLSTSHENINSELPSTYKAMVHANAKKGTLDTFKHSHPNNYTGFIIYYQIIYPYTCHIPSGDDRKTKNEILDECRLDKPKPQFFLRNGGHNYVY